MKGRWVFENQINFWRFIHQNVGFKLQPPLRGVISIFTVQRFIVLFIRNFGYCCATPWLDWACSYFYSTNSSSFSDLKIVNNVFYSMASKPINIRWIRTGSQSNLKIMYNIVLQTIFHENKNHKINTSFVNPGLLALGGKKVSFNL